MTGRTRSWLVLIDAYGFAHIEAKSTVSFINPIMRFRTREHAESIAARLNEGKRGPEDVSAGLTEPEEVTA